jgi:sulfoxide reductase heme-binding subunit YedZ
MSREQLLKWVAKPIVFLFCLTPAVLLTYNFFSGNLSFNPIDDLTDVTGRWTLRLLLITLSITPLRRISGFNRLIQFRRMLGLFTFFYASIHLSIFVVFDFYFDFAAMLRDVPQRRFITAGWTAFMCMLPLALTSTKGWIRRLGGRRWRMLHRLVYVAAIAGVTHYFWNAKLTEAGPVAYILVAVILLGYRLWTRIKGRRAEARPEQA